MKLFNIFKKESSKETKSNIQKLEKNQLSKVIGGGGPETGSEGTMASGSKNGGVVKGAISVNTGSL